MIIFTIVKIWPKDLRDGFKITGKALSSRFNLSPSPRWNTVFMSLGDDSVTSNFQFQQGIVLVRFSLCG
jgi:hypothetical protein